MIYIWVRATLDYDDETAFRAQLLPRFEPKVAVWDATFTMPYRVFRARVRDIARQNLAAVEGARVSAWEEIPDGALVVPVDDDDWFRPDLATAIERHGARPVVWPSSFLEVAMTRRHQLGIWRRRVMPHARPRFVCTTNNYALPKSDAARPLLESHVKASRWVGAQPGGAVVRLGERLSLMNRTLASQTSLGHKQWTISRGRLERRLRRYRRLYGRPLPRELAWAEPYARQIAALTAELEPRA